MEPLGQLNNIWIFAKGITDIPTLSIKAMLIGYSMSGEFLLFGSMYVLCFRMKSFNKSMILVIFLTHTFIGWYFDIFSGFNTYIITILIWICLDSLYLLTLYFFVKYFGKNDADLYFWSKKTKNLKQKSEIFYFPQ